MKLIPDFSTRIRKQPERYPVLTRKLFVPLGCIGTYTYYFCIKRLKQGGVIPKGARLVRAAEVKITVIKIYNYIRLAGKQRRAEWLAKLIVR